MNNYLLILKNNRLFWGVIALFTIVYIRGLFNAIYGIDASIYASLSAEMSETNNWLQLYHKGNDYLDKPPLHFWLSAASFKLFGINSFAYKLPSFLFTILGAYSTFRLGKLLYSAQIGKLSALFFYTCFSIVLINQDVRTDTILVGIIVFALWHLIAYVNTNNYMNFVLGFVGIGLAMLAKGPIGLMVPVLALGSHFLIKKEWSNIFKWQWILGLIISFLVIYPMLWGLYQQFDLQPDKSFQLSSGMDGTGTSGLRFYLWDQSFGRITGSNKEWIDPNASIFFFTHTFLWSFLPWSIIGLLGLFKKIKTSFSNIKNSEFFTLGAIIIPFIAMSKSQFQLPHYIYVFFPLWMILTGWYFQKLVQTSVWYKVMRITHIILNLIFIAISLLVLTVIFPTKSLLIWIPVLLIIIGIGYLYMRTKGKNQLIFTSLASFFCVVFVFNFYFIPKGLEYDGLYNAAKDSKNIKINRLFSNSVGCLTFDIYSNNTAEYIAVENLKPYINQGNYIFIEEESLENLENNFDIKSIKKYPHFSLTNLNANFLNPKTRENTLEYFYLVEI
ncbi:glycosyltransferase family 39 protein [Flavobacteriales bacterium]|nr:glycosyltransferase family 39 protein [Flavobacteriales bacterium]MDB4088717.1 glycosyltransferase family 39 protein [Flavobacteriales bacterium]